MRRYHLVEDRRKDRSEQEKTHNGNQTLAYFKSLLVNHIVTILKISFAKKENNLSNRIPGGGFYSTVEDLLKFGEAIINNELISGESLQMMLSKSGVEKPGNPYGMGWFMYGGEENPQGCFGHSGEQTGTSAQLMIIPSRATVVAVMGNTSGSWKEAFKLAIDLFYLSKEVNEMGE